MDRISIEDGRVTLADGRSGGTVTLEKLAFRGELRSLAGPAKGDGTFVVAGEPYAYRLSTNRPAADGAVRLRLTVDTADQPRLADVDGSIWIERSVPHFDANLQWAHGFGRSSTGEPFRVTGHVRGTSAAVAVDKIELQYGPEDRAVRLHGDANLTLGQNPLLSAMLSATQIDLDRLGMLPEAARRKPLAVLHSLGERWSSLQQFPIPVRLAISVDAVTLAGASLQRLSADLRGGAGAWTLDSLTLRAPGLTQIRLGGRLNLTPAGADFAGPLRIEAKDPRPLVAWLTDRSDALATAGSFRADGEVRIGPETFAIDRLKAELDRVSLEGRFAYRWPAHRPPGPDRGRVERARGRFRQGLCAGPGHVRRDARRRSLRMAAGGHAGAQRRALVGRRRRRPGHRRRPAFRCPRARHRAARDRRSRWRERLRQGQHRPERPGAPRAT